MKYFPFQKKITATTSEGICTGNWVAQSNYGVNLKPYDDKEFIFTITGILNVEFSSGGSIEYQCRLDYLLSGGGKIPPHHLLVDMLKESAEHFEQLFDENNIINNKPQNQTTWVAFDDEMYSDLVHEMFARKFPL